MKLRIFCVRCSSRSSVSVAFFTALADEGMWPINNVPKAEIKRKYKL